MSGSVLKCPTCRSRLRSVVLCPRCGTDLSLWMGLLAQAHRLREQARRALLAGDSEAACSAAISAWRIQHTEQGSSLVALGLLAIGEPAMARAFLGAFGETRVVTEAILNAD